MTIQWIIVGIVFVVCFLYIVRAICRFRRGDSNPCGSCTSSCPLRHKKKK